jgi:uncharacterized protein YegJ (DUF2314 family)
MNKYLFFFILISVIFTGCKNQSNQSKNYQSVPLPINDSTFIALKDTAQSHINVFIDSLNVHSKQLKKYNFLVKSDFVDGNEHEHMWSWIFNYKNGVFNGVFADSAYKIKNIKYMDTVAIPKKDVEDWFIKSFVTGKITGNFSEKYLKSKGKDSN